MDTAASVRIGYNAGCTGTENRFRASARECTCHTLSPARQSALPESFSTDSTGGDADYLEFQLSQEQTFPKGKTLQSKPLAWCMFNPHRVLENGTWYWRFRSVDKAGKAGEWSATYNFSVSEDIPQFVTPTFDAFMKNMPKGYPRIYCFLEEGLKKAKGNIQTSPEYKDLTNRAQRALNNNYETHPTPL